VRKEAPRDAPQATSLPKIPSATGSKNPVYSSEAVVVVDLVESTNLVTRFGNTFLLMLKHRLEHQVNEICARNAVIYSKSTGDGFLMFFPALANAIVALRQIFEALPTMNADLPEGSEIALRAGLNFGEVIADRDGDRTGSAVHKTFRLQSLPAASLIETEGGIKRQEFPEKNYTIVSEEAFSGLTKIPSLQSRFLGLCELKGFPGLHRIYQI
jgi:class 3 adenylate cyclase